MHRPTLLSGITPSGVIHIGNYLGAIKQWVELQKTHYVFAMVADLHAITVPQKPKDLHDNTLRIAKLLIACGIDQKESLLFVQSHIPAHAELGWILNTITPLGELERMTQFKDKGQINMDWRIKLSERVKQFAETQKEKQIPNPEVSVEEMINFFQPTVLDFMDQETLRGNVYAGLLNYPTLMAADILLYQTETVPVGEDQQQHLELTRSLAERFNNRFGQTFKIPHSLIKPDTARIMGLDDPHKKMSKSATSPNNYISLLDEPEEIQRKIKSAVTDSGTDIAYDEEQKPAVANLMRIYRAFSGSSLETLTEQFHGKGYADFKRELAELLIEKLAPIQKRFSELSEDESAVRTILTSGAQRASQIASKTLREAKLKVGFLLG
ncbi:MAG: Tryptophan--tRNA ligase [Parcubacteria group bacterium Gr01-1014_66]|nr:MAG: Tryptophan--tRNA ligase [Parcubacteria group bacterium Gr01-1014_66]